MTYQTTVQRSSAIKFGSMKVEVGSAIDSLTDIGVASDIEFNESFDLIQLVPDNAPVIPIGKRNHKATVKFNMWEINLDAIYLLRNGGDTKTPTAASSTPVSNELHTLTGVTGVRLNHKNGAGTIVTSVTVVDSADGATVQNTDYVLYVDSAGYTCIARVTDSSVITSGETVKVSYTYTPNASITLSSGGTQAINVSVVKLTNTNAAGKVFSISIYKATNQKGIELKFPPDDSDKNLSVGFELAGTLDATRTAGDQLFAIYDEQGV